jgi:hypothetical protein
MRRWRALVVAVALAIAPDAIHTGVGVAWAQRIETQVAFNTSTLRYHGLGCRWARKCTKNCVTIPLSEAVRRGGIPCKVCGGH